ncbi:unnamed protein product [Hydatigera taeniaeformis]|uniref:Transposase n=1 Tax=Hydatigena taeniaeformis TaxID=6205 RepID=A0A0R3XBV0_HYDTA|nr:unnamed protein product [Hydatigera taeniaeformis]
MPSIPPPPPPPSSQKNPVRVLRDKYKAKVAKWEKFFDEDPLGQKIAEHYANLRALVQEARQRIRKALANYVKQLENEN